MKAVWDDFLGEQRGRFALFLPVFTAAGILAYFDRTSEPSLAWSSALCGATMLMAAALWRWPLPRAAALCAAFACTGFSLACLATARAPAWPALPRHAIVVTGQVASVETLPQGSRVTFAAPSLDGAPPLSRALRIRLRATDPVPAAGDLLRVRALVRPPASPDYPGGRDTQREAFFAGLAGYGFAIGPSSVLAHPAHGLWRAIRARIAARLAADLPGTPGAIAATLLTGLGTAIPQSDRAAFQDSGLAHLLAVAGLHIGIVMGLVFGATRLALAAWEHAALHWPTKRIAALAALSAGAAYLALTGGHVPILRSFAMACLVTLGVLTGRRAVSIRGLCVAALVLMLISPDSVVGVSFQMSFASVLVLIAGYEMLRPHLARIGQGFWWRSPALYVAGLALTSLLAGTAALPYAAYHFGRATLYYVPANMLAVPLTALWVMPCGLAGLALMPLGLEQLALIPMGWGLRGLLAIAHGVAAWPEAAAPVSQMPGGALLLISAGLAWGGLWRGRLRLGGVLPILAGVAVAWSSPAPDILVSADAKLIAIRVQGRIFLDRAPGASAFAAEAPGRIWGEKSLPLEAAPAAVCTDLACRIALPRAAIQIWRDVQDAHCADPIILSHAALHGACPGALVVDRASTAYDGATSLRLTASAPVVTADRAIRGNRPWVISGRPLLPMAQTE